MKRLAIVVPCYNEEDVLEQATSTLIKPISVVGYIGLIIVIISVVIAFQAIIAWGGVMLLDK